MPKYTPLHETHLSQGAAMVDFAGWHMPLHYGSQLQEHIQVRTGAGMFDVSHMTVVDLEGERTAAFLQYLLTNDVARLKQQGKAMYSCMLNEQGGVLDDLIVYYLSDSHYRLVVNSATRDKDLDWLGMYTEEFSVRLTEQDQLAMIAVQGPQAIASSLSVLPEQCRVVASDLPRFCAIQYEQWFIARTGYTGEDGFEIMIPAKQAADVWSALQAAGVSPAGLGARDTLRLEAGMSLYGNDMDEKTTPLESGLGWTVAWEPPGRNFIGREALERNRAQGVTAKQVGLLLEGRGVLRAHQKVLTEAGEGVITSGTFSPTLQRSIALARVPVDSGVECEVEIRGKPVPAKVVKYPFVRNGKSLI